MQDNHLSPFAIHFPYNQEQLFPHYAYLSKKEPNHVLLESGRDGRYSIIGLRPKAVLEGKNNTFTATTTTCRERKKGNPIELMKSWMGDNYQVQRSEELPDFQCGAIGFFSYDCIRYIEKLPNKATDDLNTPDLYFLIFHDIVVYDHAKQELWIITIDYKENENIAFKRLEEYKHQWESPIEEEDSDYSQAVEKEYVSLSQEEVQFKHAVRRVQAYIAAGDVFQVNLSIRQTKPLRSEPLHIYKKLRELNPSPYMSYLQTPRFQVISGSPELLIKKSGRELSTRPIAGTRSRGRDAEHDKALEMELLHSEKERAEHVMLVDLERNDLGRVCKFGTVSVNEFMAVEKYSHVMHIVSNVQGELEEGKDAFDVVKATFPGGTITGAPKVRTMEIIEELEPTRRGLYTGSIGWIGFNGDMELNIVIRTMLTQDGLAHVQAGAGIVIDSDPKAEFKECLKKAKALWEAKRLSEKELAEQKVEQR